MVVITTMTQNLIRGTHKMKSVFPQLEIYKKDEDVLASDIPGELIDELGQLFKKYGFFIRVSVHTGQEREQEKISFIKKLLNLLK